MSFFRGGNGYDDYFGGIHRMMRANMREMEAMMFDPFGMGRMGDGRYRSPRQQMIDDNGVPGSNNRHGQRQDFGMMQHFPLMEPPFGFGFGGLMQQMPIWDQMGQMQGQAVNSPGSHVFSQSTMISMRPGQDGRTEYYEQTESLRKAGNVKETRRTVRDTGRGVEKMEIGHHIGNRGHVIEKRRDRATGGQILEKQELIGLQEDQTEQFDREYARATRQATNAGSHFLHDESEAGPHLAVEDSKSRRRNQLASPYAKGTQKRRHHSKPKVLIEEPEDEPKKENKDRKDGPKSKFVFQRPTIVELE